jgi:hypothetical protein
MTDILDKSDQSDMSDQNDLSDQSVQHYSSPYQSRLSKTNYSRVEQDYTAVNVLLLTFEFNDLKIKEETKSVEDAFAGVGYKVYLYGIKMEDTLSSLQKKLKSFLQAEGKNTLFVIYYNGHGGIEEDNTLSFAR